MNTNSLIALKPEVLKFWDIKEEDERDLILQKIRACANTYTEEQFAKAVQENFEFEQFSGLGTIYEALSELPEKWGDFLISEYQRAFKVAENSTNPYDVLECLEEIYINKNEDFAVHIIPIITPYLNHSNPVLQCKAIWIAGDFIPPESTQKYSHIVQDITHKLKHKNWRVRFYAAATLEDMKRLPKGYKPSFMDKIKAKFSNPYQP